MKFSIKKILLEILKKHEVTGYTAYEVKGNSDRGLRGQDFKHEKKCQS